MKNYIGKLSYHDWWNTPIKNFFTTAYTRFKKMPFADPHSMFDEEWLKFKDRLSKYDVLGE